MWCFHPELKCSSIIGHILLCKIWPRWWVALEKILLGKPKKLQHIFLEIKDCWEWAAYYSLCDFIMLPNMMVSILNGSRILNSGELKCHFRMRSLQNIGPAFRPSQSPTVTERFCSGNQGKDLPSLLPGGMKAWPHLTPRPANGLVGLLLQFWAPSTSLLLSQAPRL